MCHLVLVTSSGAFYDVHREAIIIYLALRFYRWGQISLTFDKFIEVRQSEKIILLIADNAYV